MPGSDLDRHWRYRTIEYQMARRQAFDRTRGHCAFCGAAGASEAHHWAREYPPVGSETADDLVPLCARCHRIATELRKETARNGHLVA